jgi:hypothetical protein
VGAVAAGDAGARARAPHEDDLRPRQRRTGAFGAGRRSRTRSRRGSHASRALAARSTQRRGAGVSRELRRGRGGGDRRAGPDALLPRVTAQRRGADHVRDAGSPHPGGPRGRRRTRARDRAHAHPVRPVCRGRPLDQPRQRRDAVRGPARRRVLGGAGGPTSNCGKPTTTSPRLSIATALRATRSPRRWWSCSRDPRRLQRSSRTPRRRSSRADAVVYFLLATAPATAAAPAATAAVRRP